MSPLLTFGEGLPSGSIVMPLIIPFAAALTPVVNSPIISFADPLAIVY